MGKDTVGWAGGVAGADGQGWRRAGVGSAAVGAVAVAMAAAGVALERLTVGRGVRRKAQLALDATGPYGTLRGVPGRVVADDGARLYYEVDEVEPEPPAVSTDLPAGAAARTDGGGSARRRRLFGRCRPVPVTLVFCHGFCLNQDSWHFQRAALRGVVRMVHWDQRSHGRSGRGCTRTDADPLTIDRLGRDLKAVIDAAAPEGPIVLVGHSMGGMTVMALAGHYPELIRERVVGVALVGTSSGNLGQVNYGLPVAGANLLRRLVPSVLRALGSQVELVERGRRVAGDLFAEVIKRYSFSSKDVDPAVARFAERMIESTPIDVVAEFYPAFQEHDKSDVLEVFAPLPVLVLAGDKDLVTPSEHSQAITDLLPRAELVLVPDAGHLVMLEHPEAVTDWLVDLLGRVEAVPGAEGTPRSAHGERGRIG